MIWGIPVNIAFDQQLYLAIEVDGGAELDPRMALTAAPYALAACSVGAGVAITGTTRGKLYVVAKCTGGSGSTVGLIRVNWRS